MYKAKLFLTAVACVTWLAACTSPDRVVRVYRDTEYVDGPFAKILVVGAHEDASLRRRFEDSVVWHLNQAGTQAAMSVEAMSSAAELNRDTLVTAANRTNADAVLITRVLDVQARAEMQEGRSSAAAQRRNNIPMADFFRYDYVEYQDPMTITTVRTVILATELYGVANETRIWSVESTSFDKASIDATIDDASRALARALRNDGLIR